MKGIERRRAIVQGFHRTEDRTILAQVIIDFPTGPKHRMIDVTDPVKLQYRYKNLSDKLIRQLNENLSGHSVLLFHDVISDLVRFPSDFVFN